MVNWCTLECRAHALPSRTCHFKTSTMSGISGADAEDAMLLLRGADHNSSGRTACVEKASRRVGVALLRGLQLRRLPPEGAFVFMYNALAAVQCTCSISKCPDSVDLWR